MKKYLLLSICCLPLCTLEARADGADTIKVKELLPVQKFYVGNALDGAIFSSATVKYTNTATGAVTNSMATLRFSPFLNIGVTFNFNLSRHFGIYTGVDLKNIGFIQHQEGYIYKRRTYNLGAPVGLKLGDMTKKGSYIFLGGGGDLAMNFKEKQYVDRSQKIKTSAWFSDRTPLFMPYVFIGVAFGNHVTLKAQYYPTNFLNPSFSSGTESYAGYDVNLILLSIGYRLNYTKHSDMVKKSVQDTKLM